MVSLGFYWSIEIYLGWQDQPVLTTATTTALPVGAVEFPAITICTPGFNYEIFHSALVKLIYDHEGIANLSLTSLDSKKVELTPIKAARIFTAQFAVRLTRIFQLR